MEVGGMKRNLLVFLLLWGGVELSAQTVLQQFASISKEAGMVADIDLPQPTSQGSVLIAMPLLINPDPKVDVKVVAVTDNAPAGGNTYKQVPGTVSSCGKKSLDIWYCENCNPDATELKFHLSGHVGATIDAFLEVSGLALSSVLDGSGVHVSDGAATSAGLEVAPSITTTAIDFIVGRHFSSPPLPTGVTPPEWKYSTSFVYLLNGAPGTYQPTLTGGKAANNFCIGMAAFKVASASAVSPPISKP
jgi:hypothetical protein